MAYPISKWIVPPIYKLWLREVKGMENIPEDKPFIIAANHTSYYDVALLHCIIIPKINKKIHTLVNSYYWRYPIIRCFLDLWGNIPVFVEKEKDAKEKNKQAFEKALNYLKENELVLIFPEGGRSPDGKLKRAYTGIARLALSAKVPVLPVGIIGAYKVLPKGKFFPRFVRCDIKIGKLMYFKKYYSKNMNNKLLGGITRKIMKQIAKLSIQRYDY